MRPLLWFFGFLIALVPTVAVADATKSLRFVPPQANLVIRIEKPRELLEMATQLDAVKQAQTLPFIREQMQSPIVQRVFQLIEYYEKDLGAKWPELVTRLAGNGITLAVKAGDGDSGPVLLIIEGTDAALTEKFLKLAYSVLEQEFARQEAKEVVKAGNYRGIDGFKAGDLTIARIGSTVLLANKKEVMQAALDLHLDGGKSLADAAGPKAAKACLPSDCFVWGWLDLDVARKAPNAKETFAQPSNDIVSTVLVGGWLDVIRRAPFAAAGLHRDKDTIRLTVRFPGGGRKGQPEQMAFHVPPAKQMGSMELLEPKGVIFSHAFYFDFNALYTNRGKIFNPTIAKQFDEADQEAKKFLPNTSLNKIYAQSGPYHRVVVANKARSNASYQTGQYYPHIAYINSMREPELGKSMDTILRSIALAVGNPYKPRLFDEVHAGVKIVGYRFAPNREVADDPTNVRYNFTPCFCAVHNQFVMCSNIEYCREIVELLQKEFESSKRTASDSPFHSKLYGAGGAELLRAFEEQVLGQIVLDQAVKPAEAQKQLQALMDWARKLGQVELRSSYLDNEFRFDVEWSLNK